MRLNIGYFADGPWGHKAFEYDGIIEEGNRFEV